MSLTKIPIVISREGKWYVASSPVLDSATQGKTEQEVKANMAELVNDYLKDPDTRKPKLSEMNGISITNIQAALPEGVSHRKVAAAQTT